MGRRRRGTTNVLFTAALAVDKLTLPTFLASHMALQREPHAARLWGWAPPQAKVMATVTGPKATGAAVADADGLWVIDLPPQPASASEDILLTDGTTTITLEDIAFGDVYLCSGQSNMEFSVNTAFNASHEIADSVNYPSLRLATVKNDVADAPKPDAASKANYTWARSGPAAFVPVDGTGFSWFSATCYFFGRDLYKALGGRVPIGLLASDWGGQRVECFSSAEALADSTCGGTQPGAAGRDRDGLAHSFPSPPAPHAAPPATLPAAAELSAPQPSNQPAAAALPQHSTEDKHSTVDTLAEHYYRAADEPNPGPMQLWNAMISPLKRMRFTGAVWYQGEANAGDPTGYACRFPAMIADWRMQFELPHLSFFYVQVLST